VSPDRLKALVRLQEVDAPSFEPPSAEDLLQALEELDIVVDETAERRIDEMLTQLSETMAARAEDESVEVPEEFLVAEGEAPRDPVDGQFEWADDLREQIAKPTEDEQIDYFAMNAILTVSAGKVVGRTTAPIDGAPGYDVFGNKLMPVRKKGLAFKLGSGLLHPNPDSDEVIAETDGCVEYSDRQIRLHQVLQVDGDVDFETGSVDSVVDVVVRGTVRSNFQVRTTQSLTVERVIEAANVDVGQNIAVRGGVVGHDDQGLLKAGGTIAASFINDMRVQAEGDICFVREILNCRLRTGGKLIGPKGTIIGGHVYARHGIETRVIGSEACVATRIAVGVDPRVLRRIRAVERETRNMQKSSEQVRQMILPLMANIRRLTPEQRERVTELMAKIDEIELQMNGLAEEREQLTVTGGALGEASVLVSEVLHPGTHLTVETRQVVFETALKGPVKIELRKIKNTTEVVAVNQRTGSVTVLPASDVDLDKLPNDEDQEEQRGDVEDGTDEAAAHNRHA
jgi:uncharacterized protein (DUF342 family)